MLALAQFVHFPTNISTLMHSAALRKRVCWRAPPPRPRPPPPPPPGKGRTGGEGGEGNISKPEFARYGKSQSVAAPCNMLRYVALRYVTLKHVAERCDTLRRVVVCYGALRCVVVRYVTL